MNPQEMERSFLGNFIHTLTIDEQMSWLQAQPEMERALNARANGENWMTTPFADALDAIHESQARQTTLNRVGEQTANCVSIAEVLSEAALPHGITVNLNPRDSSLDAPLEHRVTLVFVVGNSVIARYKLDPTVGKGRLCAAYKKFVREHLAARLANLAAQT